MASYNLYDFIYQNYRYANHNTAAAAAGFASVDGVTTLRSIRIGIPLAVWIVAPVAMPTSLGDTASRKVNRRISMAMATVASNNANWSPMHFLAPPPNGMKAKSEATWTRVGVGRNMTGRTTDGEVIAGVIMTIVPH